MNVIGFGRSNLSDNGHADEVHASAEFHELLPRADFVVLNCALTDETRRIINEKALSRFKSTAYLINTARGACVDEQALIQALRNGTIKGAALDCTVDEPLPEDSPLWSMPNVFITPHTGGETCNYEAGIAKLLETNLNKIWAGEDDLVNKVL
jgi:D-2-hydroxyacid dehydrogenase (NADP+)